MRCGEEINAWGSAASLDFEEIEWENPLRKPIGGAGTKTGQD